MSNELYKAFARTRNSLFRPVGELKLAYCSWLTVLDDMSKKDMLNCIININYNNKCHGLSVTPHIFHCKFFCFQIPRDHWYRGSKKIIILRKIFTVLPSWQSHCKSSHGSSDESITAPSSCRLLNQAKSTWVTNPPAGSFRRSLIHSFHIMSFCCKVKTYLLSKALWLNPRLTSNWSASYVWHGQSFFCTF